MALDCSPAALVEASKCIDDCIPEGMRSAVMIYLLATIAKVDPDPKALMDGAKCLDSCIPKGMMPAVIASVLCTIANQSGG